MLASFWQVFEFLSVSFERVASSKRTVCEDGCANYTCRYAPPVNARAFWLDGAASTVVMHLVLMLLPRHLA